MSPTLEVTTTLGGPDQQDEESDDGSISETGSVSDSEASEEGQQVQNPHEALDFDEGSVHDEDDNEGVIIKSSSGGGAPPPVGEQMEDDGDDDKSEDGEVSDEEGAIRDESDKQEESDGDEGELVDEVVEVTKRKVVVVAAGERSKVVAPPRDDDEDSVEEGEVTDEEVISELDRKDNKPVCRFFSKGQCTWGNNCRFLHPGVTDKGLYSMFETVPPPPPPQVQKVPLLGNPGGDGMSRPVVMMHAGPPVPESAWERGLRHAKEIIKASAKRKETDVDFEEKKINLSLAGDEEIDKENTDYYVRKPEHETVVKGLLDDPDYGLEDAHEFRRDKIDPEFVRERVHRIKPTSRVSGGGGGGAGMEGSPPPRRMVRESELRKIEIEMMRGEEGRNAPEFKRSTDAYGRAQRIPPHPYPNFPRNARARISPPLPDSFKRKRSSSRSSSSSSSSSSSKSSAGRRRRQRYYSRDSEDSRSRKRKRTDSSGSSGSRRRRNTRSSGTSGTSRSRSKSGNEEDKRRRRNSRRRRTTTTASSDRSRSRSSSSRSSSSRSPDRDRIQGGRMFVRKAPPREGERGAREAPKPALGLRMAPPLAHFEKPAQDGPPPDHHHGPPPNRWGGGQYRRAPPPQARPQRYFQNQNRGDDRPVGLVRERDLHNAPQFQSGGGVKQATTPTPSSPKTPMASPSGSPRRKTRYKREYSSDHEHGSGLSRSRSRSRSYSRSRSRSKSETSERPPYRKPQRNKNNNNPAAERRKSRTSSRSSSFSTSSRSRSRSPDIPDTERAPVRKAPPAPTSPPVPRSPAQPPPRSPPPRTRSRSSSSSSSSTSITHEMSTTTTSKRGGNNASSAKPKQNQIKLTLKNTSVRVINKHVLERLGGADDEESGGAGAPLRDDEDSNGVNAPLPPPESPPPGDDLSAPGSPKPGGGNRRAELLKQLQAVEQAIAKKRSKLDSTK